MPSDTILTTAKLRGFDLLDPSVGMVDFEVIAEHLGKEKRFNGATPGQEYSVAQHCVIGADEIIEAGGTREQAAYFLLHDAKEGLIKDDTTPKKTALARLIERRCGVLSDRILGCFDEFETNIDRPIHEAAGLAFPLGADDARAVKAMDLIMLVTEWRDLMHGAPHPNWEPYRHIAPLSRRIVAQDWLTASSSWFARAKRLLPALGGSL